MCPPKIKAPQTPMATSALPQPPPTPAPPQPVAERVATLDDGDLRAMRRARRAGSGALRVDLNIPSVGASGLMIPN